MHFCADVQIIDKEIEECAGKCQNGGICQNGECKCRKNYSGLYCQFKETDSSPILYYIMVFLVIIVITFGLFYGAYRFFLATEANKKRFKQAADGGNDDQIIDNKSGEPSQHSRYNAARDFR